MTSAAKVRRMNEAYARKVNSLLDENVSRDEKRRLSHTAAEQKRRNAIKNGYDELQQVG